MKEVCLIYGQLVEWSNTWVCKTYRSNPRAGSNPALPSNYCNNEMILKGKKYVLVDDYRIYDMISYLQEYRPDIYNKCYKIDIGWFIPVDAFDHIIGEC